jgi:hypothetical protein
MLQIQVLKVNLLSCQLISGCRAFITDTSSDPPFFGVSSRPEVVVAASENSVLNTDGLCLSKFSWNFDLGE